MPRFTQNLATSDGTPVPDSLQHTPSENDFDAVDACFFSSDLLELNHDRRRVRWYLERWVRELEDKERRYGK